MSFQIDDLVSSSSIILTDQNSTNVIRLLLDVILLTQSTVIKIDISYDAVLSSSLLCKCTSLASDIGNTFIPISHKHDLDIHSKTVTVLSGRRKLHLNVVVF